MEIRYDPKVKDAYRYSSNAQPLHTDGSYISSFPNASFIYCQASASKGGETIFIDLEDVINILSSENLSFLKLFVQKPFLTKDQGTKEFLKLSPLMELSQKYTGIIIVSKSIPLEMKNTVMNCLNS